MSPSRPTCRWAITGRAGSRTWLLRGRKAHLVTVRGMVHELSVVLRGGPGDLPGSVRLNLHGRALRPDDAVALALALDWDAIVAALAGHHPFDAARVAAASAPPAEPPAGQPLLWPMLPALSSMKRMHRLERRRPPRFAITNGDAILTALCPPGEEPPGPDAADDGRRFAAMPTPVLAITDPGFAPDLLWAGGLHFASARLRDALDLGPEAIEYRDVDASGSAEAVRRAGYRVFRVVHQADPVDLARMYGHEPDREADGRPTVAWLLSVTGPHAMPRRTIWREGFVAPAPLFRDPMERLLATEALAERVTRAGVVDVLFQDVTGEMALRGLAVRPEAVHDG